MEAGFEDALCRTVPGNLWQGVLLGLKPMGCQAGFGVDVLAAITRHLATRHAGMLSQSCRRFYYALHGGHGTRAEKEAAQPVTEEALIALVPMHTARAYRAAKRTARVAHTDPTELGQLQFTTAAEVEACAVTYIEARPPRCTGVEPEVRPIAPDACAPDGQAAQLREAEREEAAAPVYMYKTDGTGNLIQEAVPQDPEGYEGSQHSVSVVRWHRCNEETLQSGLFEAAYVFEALARQPI